MNDLYFQTKVVESLSRLEAHMEGLIGNGQPGRISKIESDIELTAKQASKLEKRIAWGTGLILGVSGTISALIHFLWKY